MSTDNAKECAMQFGNLLAMRKYADAYEMTSKDYRRRTSLEEMQEQFENIVPIDWGPIDPIEAGRTMNDWRGKEPSDLMWVYVSLGGDVYSEAVTVIIAQEDGSLKVREVEFGRP
jgi:hypothetical protein